MATVAFRPSLQDLTSNKLFNQPSKLHNTAEQRPCFVLPQDHRSCHPHCVHTYLLDGELCRRKVLDNVHDVALGQVGLLQLVIIQQAAQQASLLSLVGGWVGEGNRYQAQPSYNI